MHVVEIFIGFDLRNRLNQFNTAMVADIAVLHQFRDRYRFLLQDGMSNINI